MVDTFALLLIVIVSLWIVGWIGVRVGYHDGYQQALADREFYDVSEANAWQGPEEERCDD